MNCSFLHFFALISGRFQWNVDGLLEVVQVYVAIHVIKQSAQISFDFVKFRPSDWVVVPATRHESVELRPTVIRSLQSMTIFDPTHYFSGFNPRIRSGTCQTKFKNTFNQSMRTNFRSCCPSSPKVTISQTRIPKLQTSDFWVKTLCTSDSGAIHRIGKAPCKYT